MKKYSMFMDKKTQYFQVVSSFQIDIDSAIPIKIPARHFVDTKKLIPKFIGRNERD